MIILQSYHRMIKGKYNYSFLQLTLGQFQQLYQSKDQLKLLQEEQPSIK